MLLLSWLSLCLAENKNWIISGIMKKIAIDLTWVRHGKVGGTESSVTNLLRGLEQLHDEDCEFYLITAKDNTELFGDYIARGYFRSIIGNTISASQRKRVLWQNFGLCRLLGKNGIYDCIEPIYLMPFTPLMGIRFYAIIHDLQAKHYPKYFSVSRVGFMKMAWKNTVRNAYRVVAISDFVKDDIASTYHIDADKIVRIYDAIDIDKEAITGDEVLDKYHVETGKFYYSVSSLLPHKNLKTIILALAKLKEAGSKAFLPLLVSGVGGHQKQELEQMLKEHDLTEDVRLTGFVSDEVRNDLYKNCKVFLFPSIFEGFGMPPIEAMAFGASVITTKSSSLYEVTGGKCSYVEDPLSPDEWKDVLEKEEYAKADISSLLAQYEPEEIARQFVGMVKGKVYG